MTMVPLIIRKEKYIRISGQTEPRRRYSYEHGSRGKKVTSTATGKKGVSE